jgi:hypothetical protein
MNLDWISLNWKNDRYLVGYWLFIVNLIYLLHIFTQHWFFVQMIIDY